MMKAVMVTATQIARMLDDKNEDDSVWSSLRDLLWTCKSWSTFNDAKKEFQNQGMTADDAHQEAYQHVLPKLRRNIMCNYVRKIVDAAKLHQDPIHKKIMSTKQMLQEDDVYEAQESMKYAVKKRKFLIQEATGILSDDELDYEIEDEKEEEMR